MKKVIIRVFVPVLILGAAWAGWRYFKQFGEKQQVIPTASVRKGDVIIRSYTRGELRAVRTAMLVAPNLFGTVQITKLAPLGAFARDKDLVIEFDDSEVRSRLEEKQLELDQLDEQLKKAQAELEIRNNQDQVELLRARYAVRRAELEVQRNELLSQIDATKNKLNLEEARRRLKQLESDVKSRLEQSQAELAVLREQKNKSLLELQRERQRLSQVKLLAPMSGLVAIRQNRPMGMFFRGMQLPDLREGDQVFPGTPVADVLDLSELEVAGKVSELDRANLHDGQDVAIQLDAVPDKHFHGTIKSLSGTASANIWSGDVQKKFDVIFSVDMKELMTGLGAKPEQIQKVLETAARNRTRPAAPVMAGGPPAMMGGPAQGDGMAGGAPGATYAATRAGGGETRGGEAGRGGARVVMGAGGQQAPTPEQQKNIREIYQKALGGRNPQDLSPDEQRKLGEQIRAASGQSGGSGQRGSRGERGGNAERSSGGERGGSGDGGQGGPRVMAFAGPGATGPGGPQGMPMGGFAAQKFSEKDLADAKLPPTPEEDSQLGVLLRPGLLSDVEIIVERVPDAIHIPVQAVFEKDGKPIVYVKHGSRFDERVIKPLKRSESVMVIAEGLAPGEQVALADPNAKKDKKGSGKKSGIASPAAGGKS